MTTVLSCHISTREKLICLWLNMTTLLGDNITEASPKTHLSIPMNMFIPKCHEASSNFLKSLPKTFPLRDFQLSTSINTNIRDISAHYISTSMGSKYHRPTPQSTFKPWHFPLCEYFRSALMSSGAARMSDDCHRSRAWLTITALSGVRFDFPLADCLDFWDLFLRTIQCLLSYVLMCTGAESQPRCRTIQFAWWEQHVVRGVQHVIWVCFMENYLSDWTKVNSVKWMKPWGHWI